MSDLLTLADAAMLRQWAAEDTATAADVKVPTLIRYSCVICAEMALEIAGDIEDGYRP